MLMTMKRIFLLLAIFFTSSCSAGDIDFKSMEKSEKAFNERQRKNLIIYMPLEDLFPDLAARALAKAAGKGDVSEVDRLVREGASVDVRGTKGATSLFYALRSSNIDGFKRLLELGADPNLVFEDSSVIHLSVRHEDASYLRAVLDHEGDPNLSAGKPSETPLFLTIGVGGTDKKLAREMLLDAGADINAITGSELVTGIPMGGKTPLMTAANLVRFDIVYEFLELGGDYRLKDDSGRTLSDRVKSYEGRFAPDSEQIEHFQKVQAWLSKRGAYGG